ncbi:unnamed protein product [Rhizophagus irregularis]|uniref:POZ domain-containing protein n=1 Tax=Rhizophagus irregularis TaxID=588596 RepID=A0A2I1HF03_9GLOM|nr:POZ domain-containing protein [Rhizophagus irregularis]CAB4429291.1 unnamed protein product [Rhizophagus irregularis]CAB4432941.1 unnamed protein product [Rhizophagus irregularis]
MTTSNTRNSFSTPTYEDYFEYNWLIKDFQDIYKETETGHPMISERFTSPPFYDWRIELYPHGYAYQSRRYISLYILGFQSDFEKQNQMKLRENIIMKFDLFKKDHNNDNYNLIKTQEIEIDNSSFNFKKSDHDYMGNPSFCRIGDILSLDHNNNNNNNRIDLIVRATYNIQKDNNQSLLDFNKSSSFSIPSQEEFFNNNNFCDVTFKFDCNAEIKASRMFLAMKSKYFKRMFNGEWLESNSPIIKINNVSYNCFHKIVEFLYTDNLDVELDFNLLKEIYIESEMREIEELKMIVSKRIIKMINDDNWDEILILGWQTQNHDLKDIALEYIYNNWKKLESADKMNELLKCGDARWVREIIMASIFGINNGSRLYNFRN